MLKQILDQADASSEPGFESKDVRWAIVFDDMGDFVELIELGDVSKKFNRGKTFGHCPAFSQPEMKAGGVLKSHFLVETAEVVALYSKGEPSSRAGPKHQYFVRLLEQASDACPSLALVATVLASDESLAAIRARLQEHKANPTDKITIMIGDEYPVENPACLDWYRGFRSTILPRGGSEDKACCFATGEVARCARTHPKIKGLADVGGMPTGDVLIGFDKDAFESYGLKQSQNAAMSEQAAAAYTTALSNLIKTSSRKLAGARVVYWYKESVPVEFDPLEYMIEAEELETLDAHARARRLLDSIRSGDLPELMNNQYYALTLSGAAGRVMVRDWMEGGFEELTSNIDSWFSDLSIVNRYGDAQARPAKFFAVIASTVRDIKDLPPPFVTKMWRAAVRAEPFPRAALAMALGRFRSDVLSDNPLNHARIGVIKAYHLRKQRLTGGEVMVNLEPRLNDEHPEPAYQCGRLMAVLAGLQRSALGDVGAGVVQRYYASASVTPSLVLGRLTRTAQFHLNKLEPGLAHWYEDRLSSIWSRLNDAVPRTLDLEQQSLFALGYYQQMVEMRKKKVVEADEKKEGDDA